MSRTTLVLGAVSLSQTVLPKANFKSTYTVNSLNVGNECLNQVFSLLCSLFTYTNRRVFLSLQLSWTSPARLHSSPFWLLAMNERQRHILDAAATWQRVCPLSSALGESLDSPRGRSFRNSCSSPTSLSGPQCIHESWTWAHWDAGRRDASAPWRTEQLWHS